MTTTEIDSTTSAPHGFLDSDAPHSWPIRAALPLILFFAALLAYGFLNRYQNWGDDWAQYIIQGKAILSGGVREAVRQNAFMTHESSTPPGPVAYPWGLPLLLAAEASVFSSSLEVFKLFNILFFLLLVVSIHRLARKYVNGIEALAVACLFAFNPVLLHYCNHIVPEIPFTLASVCAFIAMENRRASERSRLLSPFAAGALAFAAFTFRSNGILILGAATVRQFLPSSARKVWQRPSLAAILAPYASFFLLGVLWHFIFPSGGEGYVQMLRTATVHTLITNARTYPITLFDFFTGGHHSAVAATLLGPVLLWGAFKTWRKTAHLSVYILLTLALYIVWPEGQGYRFMIPLTPFMVILIMLGLDELADWKSAGKFPPILARAVQFGFPVLFLLASSAVVATGRTPQEAWHPYDQPSSEMFQWIRSNTPGDAVISFFKPRALHLLTDRLCLTAWPADVPKASFFVYTKEFSFWNQGQPPIQDYRNVAALTPVFENRNFIVYRVAARP